MQAVANADYTTSDPKPRTALRVEVQVNNVKMTMAPRKACKGSGKHNVAAAPRPQKPVSIAANVGGNAGQTKAPRTRRAEKITGRCSVGGS